MDNLTGWWKTTVCKAIDIAYQSLFLGFGKALVGLCNCNSPALLYTSISAFESLTVDLVLSSRA
jgi:hypothetical protein